MSPKMEQPARPPEARRPTDVGGGELSDTKISAGGGASKASASPIVALRRMCGCARPWRLQLAGARREIEISARGLVTPRQSRRAAAALAIDLPPLTDEAWLREIGRALQSAEIEAA
jgi:hypothetical protein